MRFGDADPPKHPDRGAAARRAPRREAESERGKWAARSNRRRPTAHNPRCRPPPHTEPRPDAHSPRFARAHTVHMRRKWRRLFFSKSHMSCTAARWRFTRWAAAGCGRRRRRLPQRARRWLLLRRGAATWRREAALAAVIRRSGGAAGPHRGAEPQRDMARVPNNGKLSSRFQKTMGLTMITVRLGWLCASALSYASSLELAYRAATPADMGRVRLAMVAEKMNPLFLRPENFLVAERAAAEDGFVGCAQIRPMPGERGRARARVGLRTPRFPWSRNRRGACAAARRACGGVDVDRGVLAHARAHRAVLPRRRGFRDRAPGARARVDEGGGGDRRRHRRLRGPRPPTWLRGGPSGLARVEHASARPPRGTRASRSAAGRGRALAPIFCRPHSVRVAGRRVSPVNSGPSPSRRRSTPSARASRDEVKARAALSARARR